MENGDPLREILIDNWSSFNSEYESLFKTIEPSSIVPKYGNNVSLYASVLN